MTQQESIQLLETEITAIQTQIKALREERQQISIEQVRPDNQSPQAIAEAYRRQARQTLQQSAELKGIDDAITALEIQLHWKQQQLQQEQGRRINPIEQQVEEARIQARLHAERINQLASDLADEVKTLKAIADEISPRYWQVYYKPFITGFRSISVPHVRSDGDVWTIINRMI
jgi:chromosome segregation ATPase